MKTRKLTLNQLSGWKNVCVVFLFCAVAAIASPAQTFTNLVNFDQTNGNGPADSLVQGVDGNLYGTTVSGGVGDLGVGVGTIFKMSTEGRLTKLYDFCAQGDSCPDGDQPVAGLALGADGSFYGTTSFGGVNRSGTVFKTTAGGSLSTLLSFCCADGGDPVGTLVQGTNGNFFGTASDTVFEITPSGKFTLLYTFCSQPNCTDGSGPLAGLVQGTDGDFYGTTLLGGAGVNCPHLGCGTVFKVTATGSLTTLYSFCTQGGDVCTDGDLPQAALLRASDGNFYGTASYGGANATGGTVFKITPEGTLTTLYSFCSLTNCADGANPVAALVQGADGNFYGTTENGGAHGCNSHEGTSGCGTIFRITSSGTFTTLHKFCQKTDCSDGALPEAGLVQATNGNFYGTTASGGILNCSLGIECGTIYRFSVGLGPFAKLVQTSGKVGAKVGILGTDLTGSTAVAFNGAAAKFTVIARTAILATVPTGATSGTVSVTTPSGALNSNVAFQVIP